MQITLLSIFSREIQLSQRFLGWISNFSHQSLCHPLSPVMTMTHAKTKTFAQEGDWQHTSSYYYSTTILMHIVLWILRPSVVIASHLFHSIRFCKTPLHKKLIFGGRPIHWIQYFYHDLLLSCDRVELEEKAACCGSYLVTTRLAPLSWMHPCISLLANVYFLMR